MSKIYSVFFFIFQYFNTFCSSLEVSNERCRKMEKCKDMSCMLFCHYLAKDNCDNILDFIVKGHTRRSLHYYTWATIDTLLRQFIGVVLVYKTWKDFEFYYCSVIGMGLYPQCLRFNKLSVGFFDLFVNLTSLATTLCNLFLTRLILKRGKNFLKTLVFLKYVKDSGI